MEAGCCGDYASASPVAAESKSTAMTMLFVGFIVLFYGSTFFLCLLIYPKLPKEAVADEESGEPLPPAVLFAKYGVKGGIRTEGCAICLEDFDENDVVRVLSKCRHTFHMRCIDSWCVYRSVCPICRTWFQLAGSR